MSRCGPCEVLLDTCAGIEHIYAQLEGGCDNLGGPLREDGLSGGHIADDIILVEFGILHISGHGDKARHLGSDEVAAREGRHRVGLRSEQLREISGESDGDDGHRRIGLLGEEPAVELDARDGPGAGAGEEGIALGIVHIADSEGVVDGIVALGAVDHMAQRDFVAVPCVENVEIFHRRGVGLVARDAEEVDFALLGIFDEHIVGEGIVDVVAHVGLKDHLHGSRGVGGAFGCFFARAGSEERGCSEEKTDFFHSYCLFTF